MKKTKFEFVLYSNRSLIEPLFYLIILAESEQNAINQIRACWRFQRQYMLLCTNSNIIYDYDYFESHGNIKLSDVR